MQKNVKNALFTRESDNQISSGVLMIPIRHRQPADRTGLYPSNYPGVGSSTNFSGFATNRALGAGNSIDQFHVTYNANYSQSTRPKFCKDIPFGP